VRIPGILIINFALKEILGTKQFPIISGIKKAGKRLVIPLLINILKLISEKNTTITHFTRIKTK